jgi:hypothetical protein
MAAIPGNLSYTTWKVIPNNYGTPKDAPLTREEADEWLAERCTNQEQYLDRADAYAKLGWTDDPTCRRRWRILPCVFCLYHHRRPVLSALANARRDQEAIISLRIYRDADHRAARDHRRNELAMGRVEVPPSPLPENIMNAHLNAMHGSPGMSVMPEIVRAAREVARRRKHIQERL